MGRITVFALEDCPHCKRAKGALKQRNIPYTEISLSSHPYRRNDMLSLSDRLTVPQVFFGDDHIGGADDTLELLQSWDEDLQNGSSNFKTPLEKYEAEIASQAETKDARFHISTEPAVVPKAASPRPESDKIEIPNGMKVSVLDTMERLKKVLPRKEMPYNLTIYTNCFTGASAVDAIKNSYDCTEEEAIAFGQQLEKRQMLHHVVNDHAFSNSKDYYFRLQCCQLPEVLNAYRVWDTNATTLASDAETKENSKKDDNLKDSVGLVIRLKKMLGKIEAAMTNNQGEVNYKAAMDHESMPTFQEAVCELQSVEMGGMDRNTKLVRLAVCVLNICLFLAFVVV